jgi:hypothetical protein
MRDTSNFLNDQRKLVRETLEKATRRFQGLEFMEFEDSKNRSEVFTDDGNAHFCIYGIDFCYDCDSDSKAQRVCHSSLKALSRVDVLFDYLNF